MRAFHTDERYTSEDDNWSNDDLARMQNYDNNIANSTLERYMCAGWTKCTEESNAFDRQLWISAKYFGRVFSVPQNVSIATQGTPKSGKRAFKQSSSLGVSHLPARLTDFYVVVSPQFKAFKAKNKDGSQILYSEPQNIKLDPYISTTYPDNNSYEDFEVPDMLAAFAFPGGMRLSKSDKPPYYFSNVFTDFSGTRIYCGVLHFYELLKSSDLSGFRVCVADDDCEWSAVYAPKALVVISHYPLFFLFREFLMMIYHISLSSAPLPLERYIVNFISEVPLPPQGEIEVSYTCLGLPCRHLRISRPPRNQLPMVDFSFRILFGSLSLDNILMIFRALLSENKVCFCSSRDAMLVPALETMKVLLFPLVWQGAYIPVLPQHMREFLDAPIPFLVGINRTYLDEVPENQRASGVIFVDLDDDKLSLNFDEYSYDENKADLEQFCSQIPEKLVSKLRSRLVECAEVEKDMNFITAIARINIAFPNDDHLVPIEDFASLNGIVERTSRDFDFGGRKSAQRRKTVVMNGKNDGPDYNSGIPVAATVSSLQLSNMTSVLDPRNNVDSGDAFDAREIRAAFLRFFVACFLDYGVFVSRETVGLDGEERTIARFDSDGFYKRHEYRSRFLSDMVETQMFEKFIQDRELTPMPDEIRLFDEAILDKRRRNRFSGQKYTTPFLDNTSWDIAEVFSPPLPSLHGVPEGQNFYYPNFPDICPKSLASLKIRKPRRLRSEPEFTTAPPAAAAAVEFLNKLSLKQSGNAAARPLSSVGKQVDLNGDMKLVLLNAKVSYLKTVWTLRKIAPIYREWVAKKKRRNSAGKDLIDSLIQRLNISRILMVKSATDISRNWRGFISRKLFKTCILAIIKIQCTTRKVMTQRWFKSIVTKLMKAQTITRGMIVRQALRSRRIAWLKILREQLFHLWQLECTPLVMRTKYWLMTEESYIPSCLSIALCEEELMRLYRNLEIDNLFRIQSGTHFSQQESSSTEHAVGIYRSIQSEGKFRISDNERVTKVIENLRALEKLDRKAFYTTLKMQQSKSENEHLFETFGLKKKQKRKHHLSAAIWTDILTASESAQIYMDVMKSSFTASKYATLNTDLGAEIASIDVNHFVDKRREDKIHAACVDLASAFFLLMKKGRILLAPKDRTFRHQARKSLFEFDAQFLYT
jgi:hypothetical protein